MNMKSVFVLDVDGVLTDGTFAYTTEGKVAKYFGADDSDALRYLRNHLEIVAVSADSLGFEISRRRVVDDMNIPLHLVSAHERAAWVEREFSDYFTIYMGDGFCDSEVFEVVDLAIAPSNALEHTKRAADFVTSRAGGQRAVAEACIYILKEVFKIDI